MLNIILPSLPYQRIIDPMWQEESDLARQHGHAVCLFDAEQEKLYAQPDLGRPTLYRGWMLTEAEYEKLAALTPLLVPVEQYLASHRADGWYAALAGFTPKSVFVAANAASAPIAALLASSDRCFVKGLSKSFGASSVVHSLAEFETLLHQHSVPADEKLFVREFVPLSTQPEQRFFAVRDQAFGATDQPFPDLLKPALSALQSRWFYTVDVAHTPQGQPIIIEVGDGQVSDTKEWSATELYDVVLPKLLAAIG